MQFQIASLNFQSYNLSFSYLASCGNIYHLAELLSLFIYLFFCNSTRFFTQCWRKTLHFVTSIHELCKITWFVWAVQSVSLCWYCSGKSLLYIVGFFNSDFNKLRYDYSFLKSEYEHEQVSTSMNLSNNNWFVKKYPAIYNYFNCMLNNLFTKQQIIFLSWKEIRPTKSSFWSDKTEMWSDVFLFLLLSGSHFEIIGHCLMTNSYLQLCVYNL